MKNVSCCKQTRRRSNRRLGWLLAGLLAAAVPMQAGAPQWLRDAARLPLPSYSPETIAVILYDEQITSVNDNGEVRTTYRRAYKILRPQGTSLGTPEFYFDSETRPTFLKAWSISARGDEYEVKEKDAYESTPYTGALYHDLRVKVLSIPATEPGSVIGFEYEQKRRSAIFQDLWSFQTGLPVRSGRYTLQLPKDWEYKAVWLNHAAIEPRAISERQWSWEVQDVPAIEAEPSMPHLASLIARLAIQFLPRDPVRQAQSSSSWKEVGAWYLGLAGPQRAPSLEIRQKATELTAGASDSLEKIRRLAAFVQREIRYVAIEIGKGGYQPHPAAAIFSNRYGDCKDKVTLLSSLLQEIGVESYFVLLNAERGAVSREFPSMLNFNHVIIAIRVPDGTPSPAQSFSNLSHPRLGTLLLFDPTAEFTPLGYLPASEQAGQALLVTDSGGELVELPLHPPSATGLKRTARFSLLPNGRLSGEVEETRWGSLASQGRAVLLSSTGTERAKVLENYLGSYLGGFRLTGTAVNNLEDREKNLELQYGIIADHYAQPAGGLLLLRPRVVGEKTSSLLETKPRKYPVEFDSTTLQSDTYEFTLPPGYTVDELPPPTQLDSSFAEYRSRVEVEGNILRYTRTFQIKQILVPTERQDELKKFYRSIAADERSSAVLKRTLP